MCVCRDVCVRLVALLAFAPSAMGGRRGKSLNGLLTFLGRLVGRPFKVSMSLGLYKFMCYPIVQIVFVLFLVLGDSSSKNSADRSCIIWGVVPYKYLKGVEISCLVI